MQSRIATIALGVAIACACATSPGCAERVADEVTSNAALVEVAPGDVCSDPLASPDGRYILLDYCPQGAVPGRVVRLSVDDGSTREVASYPAEDRVLRMAAEGGAFLVVIGREEQRCNVTVGDWTLSRAPWTVSAPADEASQMRYTGIQLSSDASHAFFVGRVNYDDILFVGSPEGGGTLTRLNLGPPDPLVSDSYQDYRIFPSPDGRSVLLIWCTNLGTLRTFRRVDLRGAPSLSAPFLPADAVTGAIPKYWYAINGMTSYDGASIVLDGALGNHFEHVLARIDVEQQTYARLDPDDLEKQIVDGDAGIVWYMADFFPHTRNELRRVPRDASAGPTVVAAGPDLRLEWLTADKRTLIYSLPDKVNGGRDIYRVATDGSSAPSLVQSSPDDGLHTRQHAAGLRLVEFSKSAPLFEPTRLTTALADDATGVTLKSWPGGLLPTTRDTFSTAADVAMYPNTLALSGDGSGVYELVHCGAGIQVDYVARSGQRQTALGCRPSVGAGQRFLQVPERRAVVLMEDKGFDKERWVRVSRFGLVR